MGRLVCSIAVLGGAASPLGMSFSDYEDEFCELCEHAEADLAALQRGGAPNTRGVLQQVESDLREAAAQIKNMEVSASDDDLTRSGQVLKLLERSIMFDGVLKAVAWVLLGLLVVFILYYIATR